MLLNLLSKRHQRCLELFVKSSFLIKDIKIGPCSIFTNKTAFGHPTYSRKIHTNRVLMYSYMYTVQIQLKLKFFRLTFSFTMER